MKKLISLIVTGLLPIITNAQSFAISADRMNIAYIGIDNPLSIVSDNCSCKDIFATTENGTLARGDSCYFNYMPASPGVATIVIQKKQNGKLVKIGEQELRCKRIPDCRVAVGGKSSGLFSLNEFKVQQGVSVSFDQAFEMDLKFVVTSFKIYILYKSSEYSETVTGNRFTQSIIAQLKLLKSGDRVFFEGIKLKLPDNSLRPMNPIAFTMR